MNNITMTCPECATPDKAVGNPDEDDDGLTGSWYCFQCRRKGTYKVGFKTDES